MRTIRTTTLLGCLVDLDVLDDQVTGVEAFGVGVCFGVFEEGKEEFGRFLGPAGAGDAELFAFSNTVSQVSRKCNDTPVSGLKSRMLGTAE